MVCVVMQLGDRKPVECLPGNSTQHAVAEGLGTLILPVLSTNKDDTINQVLERWRSCAASAGIGLPAARAQAAAAALEQDTYEVELEKPLGIKFYKGSDGGTYVDGLAPGLSADRTGLFTPGDKVLATSAVFGNEMWPAAEYGRTMYTVRQRVGTVQMRLQKRYGKREDAAMSKEQYDAERKSGQVGEFIRERQIENYLKKQELKEQRVAELNGGLKLYKSGQYEDALLKFETVLGLKAPPREAAVASYNVACCYSMLGQEEAGLSALGDAFEAGYEDYQAARTDPDLAKLRASPRFLELLNKYDEPFFNENALKAIKNVFGIFGKK
eukprot:SM000212S06918  [mRNA]  locus=s212:132647:135750:- [translate_table: standard]